MAEILEFGKKAQDLKSMKDTDLRQRKLEALRKIFQCARCVVKCAKCGSQIEAGKKASVRYATPYPFCTNCQEEYEEYQQRNTGEERNPKYYWHNDQWLEVWRSWLDHQKCLDRYKHSKEFLQLLEEAGNLFHT